MQLSFRKRIRALCGFCLDHWNESSAKQPVTSHIIVSVKKDEELKITVYTIRCIRCGVDTHYFPKFKTVSKAEALRLKLKHENEMTKRREMREVAFKHDRQLGLR